MTRDTQSCLTQEILDQIGRDELLPNALRSIEDHVSDCVRCRELFNVATEEPDWTDEILPALRDSPETSLETVDADESAGHQSIVRLLGPTDDPRMLGRIGPYEVLGVIGRGGMGVVFKAFDAALDRFVAIKLLLPHLAASGAARKRFSREGQAAAAVIDDHVLPIYGVDEWQGVPYLVMQYSSGSSLQKRIQDHGPLDVKEILRVSLQTARGLAAAHAQGLVHRDVKPANILLDGTVERALLTDFGLARAVDDATITRTGTIAGTPQYMSPEQVRNETVDARSDLFSLGCTMYAMCTGRSPFRSDSTYGAMHRITHEEPTPIRELNADVPVWLAAMVERLMAKRPAARFENTREVAELLEACLAHLQQPTTAPLPEGCLQPAKPTRPSLPQRLAVLRRSSVAALTILLLLFAALGIAFIAETGRGTLHIESNVDNVSVRILREDTLVRRLTVSRAGAAVRVTAGNYLVELDGECDLLQAGAKNNRVKMLRGGSKVVKIVRRRPVSANVLTPSQVVEQASSLIDERREVKVRMRVDRTEVVMVPHQNGRNGFEQWTLLSNDAQDFAVAIWPGARGPMRRLGIDHETYYDDALIEVVGQLYTVETYVDGFRPADATWTYQIAARNIDQIRVLESPNGLRSGVGAGDSARE